MENISSATLIHEVQELAEKAYELSKKCGRAIKIYIPSDNYDEYVGFEIGAYGDEFEERISAWEFKYEDGHRDWTYVNKHIDNIIPSQINLFKKESQ